MTEQEQIELLKNWLKQYSMVILAGVVIAGIAIFGWYTYQQRQIKIQSHASLLYDNMLTLRSQHDQDAAIKQADKLMQHYKSTVYAQMAALMLARFAVLDKNYAAAESQFNWVLNKSHVNSIKQIARIRLARLLIAEKKPNDAITTLETVHDTNFDGLTYEVRGDAYLALQNTSKAREAYQNAIANLPNAEVVRPLLQMKYDNLATQPVS